MASLPPDFARATRKARVVTDTDTSILALFPNARDGISRPEAGFFESASDAQAVLGLKKSLIGEAWRRFAVEVAGEVWIDPLEGIPTYHLTDSDLGVDANVMLCRLEVDMEDEITRMEVLG